MKRQAPNSASKRGLIRHCSPVLSLYGDLLELSSLPTDPNSLYSELHRLIKDLESELEAQEFDGEIIKLASYSLCCALDEAMDKLSADTGSSDAINHSLLYAFHHEPPTSANLLRMAKRVIDQKNPELIEVLSVIYMILEIGYQGNMQNSQDNANLLRSIKSVVANHLINEQKAKPATLDVAPSVFRKRHSVLHAPFWVMLSFTAMILLSLYRLADGRLTSLDHSSDSKPPSHIKTPTRN